MTVWGKSGSLEIHILAKLSLGAEKLYLVMSLGKKT